MAKEKDERLAKYPKTDKYRIIDTIGVPHPYCIGIGHLEHASDNWGGILGKEAIMEAEKKGIRCGIRGCQLPYEKHEQALLVQTAKGTDLKDKNNGLHAYLLECKPLCEADGFAGFAFIEAKVG